MQRIRHNYEAVTNNNWEDEEKKEDKTTKGRRKKKRMSLITMRENNRFLEKGLQEGMD